MRGYSPIHPRQCPLAQTWYLPTHVPRYLFDGGSGDKMQVRGINWSLHLYPIYDVKNDGAFQSKHLLSTVQLIVKNFLIYEHLQPTTLIESYIHNSNCQAKPFLNTVQRSAIRIYYNGVHTASNTPRSKSLHVAKLTIFSD